MEERKRGEKRKRRRRGEGDRRDEIRERIRYNEVR